ncbi:9d55524f-1f75-458c-83f6-ea82d84c9cce-CDS [Sclerotinia trifoliorum]|uniref:9d55524f-1f75-458c-83f6-ea82d84c9cce-CDS n=1 Tax=Sclerotinia trifoliorum TaxID=28548 RepID=A0A8H2ZPX4_9HELO|nr:9d55524f-1f75-458c-83f6-ea82d84c9cce-CDS [Sclerotinia trifoliorum]
MVKSQIPRENSRPFFSEKDDSCTSPMKTSIIYITTIPKPSASSSSSSTRSCPHLRSCSHSRSTTSTTLTTKMRSLWSIPHTKLLPNLHVNLNPLNFSSATNLINLPKIPSLSSLSNLKPQNLTPTNPPPSFTYTPSPNYTPTPNLSSPNGLPATPYENQDQVHQSRKTNPLSGPSTRRAEYLFSRVDRGFLEPDISSLVGSCGFHYADESECMSEVESSQLEYKTRGRNYEDFYTDFEGNERYGNDDEDIGKSDINAKEGKIKQKREKSVLGPWKIIRKSCWEVLEGINTQISGGFNTEVVKCVSGGRVNGQENGNRGFVYVGLGIEDEDEAEGEEEDGGNGNGYGVYTEGCYGCDDYGEREDIIANEWDEWNEVILTRSQESIVEVLLDVEDSCLLPSSPPVSLDTSSRIGRQEQNSNQLSGAFERQVRLPIQTSHPIQVDSLSSDGASLYEGEGTKRKTQEKVENKVEGTMNQCIIPPLQHAKYNKQQEKNKKNKKENGRQLLVADFAYMEMRPVSNYSKDVRSKEIERMSEGGSYKGESNGYFYRKGFSGGDKWGNDLGYAKSELELEDSMYEEDEEMGFKCESESEGSRSNGIGSLETSADTALLMDMRRNKYIFNSCSNSNSNCKFNFYLPPKLDFSSQPHPHQPHQSLPQNPQTPFLILNANLKIPRSNPSPSYPSLQPEPHPNPELHNININTDLHISTSPLSLSLLLCSPAAPKSLHLPFLVI